MKFNMGKWCTLHRGLDNPGCMDRLGNERFESRAVERRLGALVHGKLNMCQQCPGSQEGQPSLGDIRESMASQAREGTGDWGSLTFGHVNSFECHYIKKT